MRNTIDKNFKEHIKRVMISSKKQGDHQSVKVCLILSTLRSFGLVNHSTDNIIDI
jgi:hypothetical protein